MLKYRADKCETQSDGAIAWFVNWMGGPSLSRINNCRTELGFRVTAFVIGEPDTYFSIPAVCSIKGKRVRGYITTDDDGYIFKHCYY